MSFGRPIKSLVGLRFGLLLVIAELGGSKVLCRCDNCGKEKAFRKWNVKRQNRSCGCRMRLRDKKPKPLPKPRWRKTPGTSAAKQLYRSYMRRANKCGLTFALDIKQFKTLTSSKCHYCGVQPLQSYGASSQVSIYLYNGIDRVDNTKGYTLKNAVACCKFCNNAKSDYTASEFLAWLDRVAAFRTAGATCLNTPDT